MATHVYGSLTLAASSSIEPFTVFEDSRARSGAHTESRFRGLFQTLVDGPSVEAAVALPQRNKYMNTSVVAEDATVANVVSHRLSINLADLDSRFEGARQLYKLQKLQEECSGFDQRLRYMAVINNTSEHASFAILSQKTVVYVIGVYDTVNNSVRLVWTTDDTFVETVREHAPTRYTFYRFPEVYDRPLFLYTQSVCAKWYSWSRTFNGIDGILRAFNALENFLYKNPNLPEINRFEKR
jgi:hypothetical protein